MPAARHSRAAEAHRSSHSCRARKRTSKRSSSSGLRLCSGSPATAGSEGVVSVGTVRFPDDRLYRLLDDVAQRAQRLQVRPRRLPVVERLAAVRSGELDAALVRGPVAEPRLAATPVWTDPLLVAVPAGHPLAAQAALRLEQLGDLPLRLAPRDHNPPFHDLITAACRDAGIDPPLGPPFRDMETTLADLATGDPTWTVFYAVVEPPRSRRVAIRPLAEPSITTSLAFPSDRRPPGLRHLVAAVQAAARRSRQDPSC